MTDPSPGAGELRDETAPGPCADAPGGDYSRHVLAELVLVYVLNFLDRARAAGEVFAHEGVRV